MQVIIDSKGKYVIVQGHLWDQEISIAGIYGPNNNQIIFWNEIQAHLSCLDDQNILLLGDCNTVMDPYLERYKVTKILKISWKVSSYMMFGEQK